MSALLRVALAGLCAGLAAGAAAQDPRDEDVFGAPAPPATEEPEREAGEARSPATGEGQAPPARERATPGPAARELAPEAGAEARLREAVSRTRDTLDIGGQLYLRACLFSRKRDPPSSWDLTAPSLLDVYLDARPTDRVRAFVLARTQYDPTASEATQATAIPALPAGVDPSAIPGARARKVTDVALDQLWLRWDLERRVFLTAGKQHVKWGVGRFWNPTDFLHAVRRDPLAPFDARTGTTMLRVQVPWEARGWSFQAAAVAEPLVPAQDQASPRAGQLGALGGAARAELVLGGAELGVGGVAQKGRPSRLGLDLSGPLGELDAYGELALRSDPELPLWRELRGVDPSLPVTARFVRRGGADVNPSATAGASWTRKYGDQDTFTVGAEYFWNRNGYGSARIYPWLLLQDAFTPFYVGQHYAGAYVFLPAPGSWDRTTFTASVLANVSDRSGIARLDVSQVVLTYLRLEAFVAGHAGAEGGEFRLGLDLAPQDLGAGVTTPRIRIGAPLVDLGVAVRVAL